jgi:hypothetical protein
MEAGFRTPLLDLFRRGDAPRDVRLIAARGALAPRASEQMALLVQLAGDADTEVASTAQATLAALPTGAVRGFLARADAPSEVVSYFAGKGIAPDPAAAGSGASEAEQPLVAVEDELPDVAPDDQDGAPGTSTNAVADEATPARVPLSTLPVIDRIKLAMRGTREQRVQLIRDPNRLVAAAVLSSPKLSESEVEVIARMANVSEDVLRVVGTSRAWTKNYAVVSALTRNPKTPPAVSMSLVMRLNERDLKGLSIDRNVPEGLRIQARKMVSAGQARRR